LSKLLSDADLSRAIAQISNPLFDQSVYKKATQMANALEDSAIGQAIKQIKNMEGSANMHTVKMAKLMEESAAGQAIKLWKNMEENAYGHAVKMANLVENSAVERAIKQIKDMEGTAYGQAIEIASLMEGSAINKALKQWSATFDPIAKIREDTLKLWDSQFSVAEVIKKWSAPSSIQGALKSTVLDEVFSRLDTHDFSRLVARISEEVSSRVADGWVPTTATATAAAISTNDVQLMAKAVSQAVIDHLDAKPPSKDRLDSFYKLYLPLLLFVLGIVCGPLWQDFYNSLVHHEQTSVAPEQSLGPTINRYVVICPEVLMRLGPNTQQRFLGRIPQDSVVSVIKQRGQWSLVRYNDHVGWVKTKYLRTLASMASSLVSVELIKKTMHED
jgi:hypothetical protein